MAMRVNVSSVPALQASFSSAIKSATVNRFPWTTIGEADATRHWARMARYWAECPCTPK